MEWLGVETYPGSLTLWTWLQADAPGRSWVGCSTGILEVKSGFWKELEGDGQIPWMEEPGRLQSMGSLRVRHNWATYFHFHALTTQEADLEKGMTTHFSILVWSIPWTEDPGGLQFMGSQRVRYDWATSLSLSLSCIGEGNGSPLQCSCLENPRDGGAWWVAVYGVTQNWTRLKRLSSRATLGVLVLKNNLGSSPMRKQSNVKEEADNPNCEMDPKNPENSYI